MQTETQIPRVPNITASLEVSHLFFKTIEKKMAEAHMEDRFTIVQNEVVAISMNHILLVEDPIHVKERKERQLADFLLDMIQGDHYEVAQRLSTDNLLEQLCRITARKGETKMDEAIVCEVCERMRHPLTWWFVRLWKKALGKL